MSTTDSGTPRLRPALVAGLGLGLVVLVGGGVLLREHGPGNMGNGFLAGGALSLVAAAFAVWRSTTRPASASTAERAFTQTGDERDDAVLTRALAVLGLCAVPTSGIAAVAIALGAAQSMVLALLLFGQLAIGVSAFVVVDRRS